MPSFLSLKLDQRQLRVRARVLQLTHVGPVREVQLLAAVRRRTRRDLQFSTISFFVPYAWLVLNVRFVVLSWVSSLFIVIHFFKAAIAVSKAFN